MTKTGSEKNLNAEAFYRLSYGLYIVSTASKGKKNGYISNAVFQVTAEPPQFAICCSKKNYTADLIAESGMFSVSVLSRDAGRGLISTFGYQSGRDTDKFSGIKYITNESGIPVVTEDSLAWFECRVNQSVDVGTHILFTGEILREDIIDSKSEPLTYAWYREHRKGRAPANAPTYIPHDEPDDEPVEQNTGSKYKCAVCGYVYDPAIGDPDNGIPPGTDFNSLSDDWRCPVCGADKVNFSMI